MSRLKEKVQGDLNANVVLIFFLAFWHFGFSDDLRFLFLIPTYLLLTIFVAIFEVYEGLLIYFIRCGIAL